MVIELLRPCTRCGRELPAEQFPLRRKDEDRRHTHCRDCKAHYQREWYRKNRARHTAAVATRRAAVRAENKVIVREAKDRPCADCGRRYPPYVMDFDHVRGVKVGDVARLKAHLSPEGLRREIAKCEVVCANCHRERTYQRKRKK